MTLLRRWVDTWRNVGEELDSIHRAELEAIDTQEAIRQIFGDDDLVLPPPSPTSGLVEQQMWFARLRDARREK